MIQSLYMLSLYMLSLLPSLKDPFVVVEADSVAVIRAFLSRTMLVKYAIAPWVSSSPIYEETASELRAKPASFFVSE